MSSTSLCRIVAVLAVSFSPSVHNLGAQIWVLATYLMSTGIKGVSSLKLHRDLGITQKTAWHLAHRIRETWNNKQAPFAGPAEVDETYIGVGKRLCYKELANWQLCN